MPSTYGVIVFVTIDQIRSLVHTKCMNTPAGPSWDLFAAFRAVVRTGSLSAAARDLGVAQPTVRRQIEALEEQLGIALFTRSQVGLAPTEAALAMMPYAEAMAASAEAALRVADGGGAEVRGTIRVTSSEVVAIEVLPPILASLRRAYPRLAIEVSGTNANEDLVRRDADIAVRMSPPTQGALVAKRVGSIALGFYASADYLAERPPPRALADLKKHALVGRDRDGSFLAALEAVGISLVRGDFAYRTDSDVGQLAAIRAGVGIGVCQSPIAARSGLVRVLPKVGMSLPVFVVTHEDLRQTRRIAAVFDHLVAALS